MEDQSEALNEAIKENMVLNEKIKVKDEIIGAFNDKNNAEEDELEVVIDEETNRPIQNNKVQAEFKCADCNFTTKVKKHLKGHSVAHTGQYQCLRGCRKITFKTLYELDMHIKTIHEYNTIPENEYDCELCGKVFNTQSNLRKHITRNHETTTKHNCDLCGLVLQNIQQLRKHTENCSEGKAGGFQQVRSKLCRYFINGNCWRQDECKFIHNEDKKSERSLTPPCKNGTQCLYLARGACKFFHKNVGVQITRSNHKYNSRSHDINSEQQANNRNSRPWCKFLEDCTRTPNCYYKHYDEVFPQLPKTNNPPWINSQSMWEEY